ncbi:MAG: alanine--tRNA ligase [bacterium]|nr:alanine--tRNA ligase [bacterium]
MESSTIRAKFLKFFENRGHKIIPSASLVPENDPSVLFNTAGMQPLVPYLLGQKHPMGARLANVQKCVRTQDIDEVGDKTHDTFFEMLGNWSLGDYFKEDAIKWSYELLTSKEEGFGLDPARLYITVFEGDDNAPRDTESAEIWQKVGIPEHRIYFMPAKSNWWSAGDNGPCGPDTEMFYDITGTLGDMTKEEYLKADAAQQVVEIWNDVFMEYEKKDGKVIGKLKNKNVDTGAGLERLSMMLQNKDNIFETDLFQVIMGTINSLAALDNERAKRIVADHVRTSVFMISDGVAPSKTAQGYILRRLLRRAVRYADVLGMKQGSLLEVADAVIKKYETVYSEIAQKRGDIVTLISEEETQFRKTLTQGLKEFEKGTDAFVLATTYGFPIELTMELAEEKGRTIDLEDFKNKMSEHQKLSQTASAGMFRGGLANHNEKTVRLHTAHHLLLAALQNVVGPQVKQRGSNITEERLRIDFLCDHKLTDDEKKNAEEWVNDKIQKKLNVVRREMPFEEAQKIGAEMEFGAKYADIVSVYFIEDGQGTIFSKEFCGGPHVTNTSELSVFKIQKEEAVSQGIRRIKGVLL